jgi:hypothetical protein
MTDAQSAYGHLPLSFEANQGQTDGQVKFLSRGKGYNLFLTATEAVLALTSQERALEKGIEAKDSSTSKDTKQVVLEMSLVGANPSPRITGLDALPGKANYFIGNDPRQWHTNVPMYGKVQYENVYPGVDLVFYGYRQQLEFDFVLAPGADPSAIILAFEGAEGLNVDAHGNLLISNPAGTVRLNTPVIYQQMEGLRKPIAGGYWLKSDKNQVAFQIASYDRGLPLVIDPVLSYSTYLGGSSVDWAETVSVNSAGEAYVAGRTSSSNFPTTVGVLQSSLAGALDVFVTKLNATGTGLVYCTYLGGSNDDFILRNGLALDSGGNAYLTGVTNSTNFPVTAGVFQSGYAGGPHDGFVSKLDPSGATLVYSTYLGGTENDEAYDIAIDGAGNAYVTGLAQANFPTTVGAFNTTFPSLDGEIFVTKLNATGTGLLYSTAIPGAHPATDVGTAIAVDAAGHAYVTGATRTAIGTPGAFQTVFGGNVDGFVLKLNPAGSALVYATNLGGSGGAEPNSLAIDATGNVYVCGGTGGNFPTTSGALQTTFAGGVGVASDAFVTKLNPTGTALVYSTYIGGNGEDSTCKLDLDQPTGVVHLVLGTRSTNLPVTPDALQPTLTGGFDVFLAKLNATGSALLYGSYFGGSGNEMTAGVGIALDLFGNPYVVGNTLSTNLPITAGAIQTMSGGGNDGFVAKFTFNTPVTIDIKPGSFPNSINLGSQGSVPVAILGSATFDASQVDPLTVTLADAQVKLKGKGTPMASLEDVNGDGFLDMVVHVSTEALQINANDTDAIVGGSTVEGTPFRGKDSIRVVPAT